MRKALMIVATASLTFQASAADFSRADICKATIAVEMGHDSSSMKTEQAGNNPIISYIRNDDLQQFTYRCKFIGYRVVWAGYFDEDSAWGRWRDSPAFEDAVTTFEVRGTELLIKNDQMGDRTFAKNQFR